MRWLLAILCLMPAAAGAQSPTVPLESTGVEARAGQVARVTIDYTEVRAGPGQAYVSRGRVYQGDRVEVQRRADNGAWVEVVASGGIRGWLPVRDIKIVPGETAKPVDGASDAGRDRRQRGFTYDDQGRRRRLDGRAVGSGEGARTRIADDEDLSDFPDAGSSSGSVEHPLQLRLGFGATQIRRVFVSNSQVDSYLSSIEARPVGFGPELEVAYTPLPFLQVRGGFRDARFTETRFQTALYNEGQPFGLAVDTQQAELDVVGRLPIAQGWIGVYVGGHFWRQAFQEIRPVPLFLSHTTLALAAGADAGWAFGPVDLAVRGGVLLPLSLEQSPASSGDSDGFGYGISGELAWAFTSAWAVVAHGHTSRITTDFAGNATHIDTTINPDAPAYNTAQSIDTLLGGGLSVRWRP